MAIIATAGSTSDFKPAEPGAYVSHCYGLIDMGDEYSEKFEKVSRKCKILWELAGTAEGDYPNKTVSKDYTLSLNSKSTLRKDLRAWRGREFTDEELKAFNMRNILNAPCQLQITNTDSNGKTYANIAAIMNLPKGMPKPVATHQTVYWDFEENEVTGETWEKIPEWIRNRIMESETYKYITKGENGHLTAERREEIQQYQSYKALHSGEFVELADDDEALPF